MTTTTTRVSLTTVASGLFTERHVNNILVGFFDDLALFTALQVTLAEFASRGGKLKFEASSSPSSVVTNTLDPGMTVTRGAKGLSSCPQILAAQGQRLKTKAVADIP